MTNATDLLKLLRAELTDKLQTMRECRESGKPDDKRLYNSLFYRVVMIEHVIKAIEDAAFYNSMCELYGVKAETQND